MGFELQMGDGTRLEADLENYLIEVGDKAFAVSANEADRFLVAAAGAPCWVDIGPYKVFVGGNVVVGPVIKDAPERLIVSIPDNWNP